jgi:hypothetical protein
VDDILWESVAKIGGVLGIVGFAVRWIYGIERDMIRRYARQLVETEADNVQCRRELDQWRTAYWDLRAAVWNSGVILPPVPRAIPPGMPPDPTTP